MDSHPNNQFSSNFPLQPFTDNGTRLSYDDTRRWIYTTIGDMAKDARALGYMYAPPLSPDAFTTVETLNPVTSRMKASGGHAISIPAIQAASTGNSLAELTSSPALKKVPYVVFHGVGCTDSSYRIDVLTPHATSTAADPTGNPDFIGQITRLGMGPGRPGSGLQNNSRCRKTEVTRVLSAEKFADMLTGTAGGTENVQVVITDLHNGRLVPEVEYKKLPGFEPQVLWLSTIM